MSKYGHKPLPGSDKRRREFEQRDARRLEAIKQRKQRKQPQEQGDEPPQQG